MRHRGRRGGAQIDQPRLLREFDDRIGRQLRQRRHTIQDRRSLTIDTLHLGEVAWRLRLTIEHVGDEGTLVGLGDAPVRPLLVPDGTRGHRAERLPAGRPGTVSGPYLKVVRQRPKALERTKERARASLHGVSVTGRAFEQVRTPDVADEDEVAREDPHCPRRPRRILYYER